MLEVVVIGAGIAGFSSALALWERGAAVTLVEAARPGAGATGASAGMLTVGYEAEAPDEKFRLCLESRRRYARFVERVEELAGRKVGLRWDGMLVANLTPEEHEAAEAALSWQREAGLEPELLTPVEARRIEPQVAEAAVSYVWLPGAGQVDAQRLAEALGAALARTEIRLITGNRAAEIIVRGGAAVGVAMADGRRLEADRVVLAAGAWSPTIGGLPRALPVRPVRGQMLRFPAGAVSLRRLVGARTGRYAVPREDGTVLAGSTMEEVGYDQSISEERLREIHEGVARLVPALADRRPAERWAGLRPLSADSRPVLGPDPELDGLLYATGYGRDGILIAPLAAKIVAELAVSGRSSYDWRPFRPDRFEPAAE